MIFITIGTQLPFDRLIEAIDIWAEKNKSIEIFAQMGNGRYLPQNFKYETYIPPDEFNKLFQKADLIISHAGMGSVLTAISHKKPIVLFPRDYSLGEHRNNHQLATANSLKDKGGISVAFDVKELYEFLDNWQNIAKIHLPEQESKKNLIATIETFINDS